MNPRKLLRIARWEVTKNAGGLDRRTVAVVVVAVGLLGVVVPMVGAGGVGVDDGLYRVAVEEDSQYYDVVANDSTFAIEQPGDGEIDLLIDDSAIQPADDRKGAAAFEELRESVRAYNNRVLSNEPNQTAAFPVSVTVQFREQASLDPTVGDGPDQTDDTPAGGSGEGGSGNGSGGSGDGPGDGDSPDETPAGGDTGDSGSGDGGAGGDSSGDGPGDGDSPDETPAGGDTGDSGSGEDGSGGDSSGDESGSGGAPAPGGFTGPLSADELSGSPADINPPFPFQSLVLAFIFVIPLNFLIQAYGSTMLSERLKRRGELLLVSPVTRFDIIGGKTLPYFAGAMAVEGAIAVGLVYLARGDIGGVVSMLAVAPLVLLFLGATFLGAMFARSFKELTFVTVTITVVLTSYAFVPAIFTDVGALALISPLTLVVRDLQGEAIELQEFVFSTLPPFLSAVVFFGLGSGLYREEDMFDQRSISGKVLDALAGPISRPYHVGVMTMVLIPFVFVVQLLAIALLFATGDISVVLILVVVAVVEEIAKSLHIYAAYDHNRFERTARVAVGLGIASGVGFFLGEKIALLAQLVGLPELAVAEAGLTGGIVEGPIVLLFLLAPLALHVTTAAVSAVGARKGRTWYLVGLAGAMAIHFLYNFAVVRAVV